MKKGRQWLYLGLVLLMALVSTSSAQAGASKTFYLSWHNVVPSGSGDPNMFGDGTVDINAGKAQICYSLRVFVYPSDGSNWPPVSTGIYQAPAGANGPRVVDLNPDFSAGPNVSDCVSISSSLAHSIKQNPSGYYILVTSIKYPDGAVRGQLVR